MEYNNEDREVEIDIKDLLKTVCYKWRTILICALIGIFLVGGIKIAKNFKENKAIDKANKEIQTQESNKKNSDINSLDVNSNIEKIAKKAGLSDSETAQVNVAVNMYQVISESYKELDDMTLGTDGEKIYKTTMLYEIISTSDNGGAASLGSSVIYGLTKFVDNEGLANNIIDDGYEGSIKDLKRLVSVVDGNTENVYSDSNTSYNTVSVIVRGASTEELENLTSYVDSEITSFASKYSGVGTVTISLIDSFDTYTTDSSILEYKQTQTDNIAQGSTNFKNYTTDFTDAQKAVVNAVTGADLLEVEDASVQLNVDSSNDSDITPHVSLLNGITKYVLVGFAAGLFIPIIIIILLYVLSATIKVKDDLETLFNYYILGSIEKDTNHKGLDKVIDNIFKVQLEDLNNRENMIAANIKALCVSKSINKIFFNTSVVLNDSEKASLNNIKSLLAKDNIDAVFGNNATKNVADFNTMIEIGNVVIVEKLHYTKISSLDELGAVCSEHNIKVLGAIYA